MFKKPRKPYNIKLKYLIYLFFINISVFSQTAISISGTVKINNKPLNDCVVELKINNTSRFVVTNKKGNYIFSNLKLRSNDSVFVNLKQSGFVPYIKQIKDLKENLIVDINLKEDIQQLKEVVIKNEKEKFTARKSTYKINSKDYLTNAKASEVLNNIPNVFSNQLGETIVDGKLSAKIFIDGIEQLRDEINTIEVKNIEKVEVISNPSSSYSSEFLGAIINIITKKESSNYFKGSLTASSGYRNNAWNLTPSFTYKIKNFILKSFSEYKEYDQLNDYSLHRNDNTSIYQLYRSNYSKGVQKFTNTKAKLDISKKSSITLSNSLFGYTFYGDAFGTINSNSLITNFSDKSKDKYENWNLSSVYKYVISENKNLYVKSKYDSYDIEYKFDYLFNNFDTEKFYAKSLNKEFSSSLNYEVEDFIIYGKTSSFYADAKYINRNFSFSNTNFYINQNVFNTSLEIDNEWSEKFSTDLALTIENTTNFNSQLKDTYTLLLPNFNGLYHFNNKLDSRIGYSRKVLRPDADELNDELVAINPGIAKQGNSKLNPQIRNYYYLSFTKSFKTESITVKLFNESINNAIVETFKNQEDLLLQTLENASKFNSTGFNVGFRTKILKK